MNKPFFAMMGAACTKVAKSHSSMADIHRECDEEELAQHHSEAAMGMLEMAQGCVDCMKALDDTMEKSAPGESDSFERFLKIEG